MPSPTIHECDICGEWKLTKNVHHKLALARLDDFIPKQLMICFCRDDNCLEGAKRLQKAWVIRMESLSAKKAGGL